MTAPHHNIEAEQGLLGAILLNNGAYGAAVKYVQVQDFFEPLHAQIYEQISRLIIAGKVVTPVTLKNEFPDLKLDDNLTISEYLARLCSEATTVINAPDYAQVIHNLAVVRNIVAIAGDLQRAPQDGYNTDEALQKAFEQLDTLRVNLTGSDDDSASIAALASGLVERMESGEQEDGQSITTGFTDLDERLGGGYRDGRLFVLAGRPGSGKAQPLSARVLTTEGWKLMGDLKVGDFVVRPSGGSSQITGIFPQGIKDIFEVAFHDGRRVRCCDDHLWKVTDRHWREWRVLPLKKMRRRHELFRLSIPLEIADDGHTNDLPMDPYLFGVLLGDGNFHPTSVRFSTADEWILNAVRKRCPRGHTVNHLGKWDYRIVAGKRGGDLKRKPRNLVFDALRALGLGDARSHTKFIPPCYMNANLGRRLEVLQGLLDTDGTVGLGRHITFDSTSFQLAKDVQTLVRSLGGWAKLRERARPSFTHKGERRIGKRCWRVSIRHRFAADLFSLPRKVERIGDGGQYAADLKLSVSSIKSVGQEQCQCISLSSSDGLYFTDDFTVTHNTVFAVASARRVARQSGNGVLFFSMEMPRQDIIARFAACELARTHTPLDYRDILVGNLDDVKRQRVAGAAQTLKDLPIFIDCTAGLSMFEISARARIVAERWRRQGIKLGLIVVDYLGLVKVSDRYKGNKVDELGDVAKGAKLLASQLQTSMLMLAQLNRGVEQRDDKRPVMSDLRASGEIEEHADVVGLLYRPAYYDQRMTKVRDSDPEALAAAHRRKNDLDLNLDKNRLGPTSSVKLWCDVAKSAIDNGGRDY